MGSIMNQALLRVVQAGPLVTFQDDGRPGHMRFGVSASGPMDAVSFATANLAIGNIPHATAIEVSMGGLTLECLSGTVTMAVVGGQFQLTIAGRSATSGTIFTIEAGETLTIRPGEFGNWCYVAFAGSIETQQWLDHVSTHAPSGFGGGQLAPDQTIKIENALQFQPSDNSIKPFSSKLQGDYFRVVMGPQEQHFTPDAKQILLGSEFALSEAYDRMGVKLNGPKLPLQGSLSIPSEPILKGSIQVSGDGVPTVLLADHQTTGGYPKIATLVSADLDVFVQQRLRKPFRFMAVSPQSSIRLARLHAIELRSYFNTINRL